MNPNTPVIVGSSQLTQRWQEGKMPLSPLAMIAQVTREATEDSGKVSVLAHIDGVFIANIFGWGYEDACGELAQMLGIQPKRTFYSTFGGNTPQAMVNQACVALEKGELQAVLLSGGEANYGLTKALKSGMKLDWTPKKNPAKMDGINRAGASDLENNYDLYLMTNAYPLFESALRAKAGRSLEAHQQYLGKLYEPFAKVASQNPFAWANNAFSATQIALPDEDNRYVAFPYTKRMCANNNVDQAVALILTTVGNAEKWGISPEKWVFPSGGADLYDIWDFACRPDLTESPALKRASESALAQAGLSLADIDAFDLYSCFPAAVQIAQKAIGIPESDAHPMTLTGGLSFFGGPWNNYSMHAIAEAVAKIRENPSQNILINALGWYITKHSVGIYSKKAPAESWQNRDFTTFQAEIDAQALPEPVAKAEGSLKVLAYSLYCDRNGEPNKGVVLGEMVDGRRTFACIDTPPTEWTRWMQQELVGQVGQVYYEESKKRNFVKF
jgi:acetyl-CoA C-acetyltransferase